MFECLSEFKFKFEFIWLEVELEMEIGNSCRKRRRTQPKTQQTGPTRSLLLPLPVAQSTCTRGPAFHPRPAQLASPRSAPSPARGPPFLLFRSLHSHTARTPQQPINTLPFPHRQHGPTLSEPPSSFSAPATTGHDPRPRSR